MTGETNGNGDSIGITSKWGSVTAKRGSELIALACISLVFFGGYAVYRVGFELADALRTMAKEQRLMSCIISTDQDKREAQWANPNSYCNRQKDRL